MTTTVRMRHVRALLVALIAANGALSLAGSDALDALRGQVDLSKCKDPCNELSTSVNECGHWNPGQTDSAGNTLHTTCSSDWCIQSDLYYAECPDQVNLSDAPCPQTNRFSRAVRQQIRTTSGLTCNDTYAGNDQDGFGTIPGLLQPSTCRDCCPAYTGKCFLDGCMGADVDGIEGVTIETERWWTRLACP